MLSTIFIAIASFIAGGTVAILGLGLLISSWKRREHLEEPYDGE